MAVRSVVAGIAVALSAGFGSALAADLDRYEPEDQFGGWLVLCDSEDDMAAITYFDCVVQSATAPAVVLSSLGDVPAVSLADGGTSGRLELAEGTLVFDDCPEAICPLPGAVEAFAASLSDGNATVLVGDQRAALSADGFEAALDLARSLPN